MLEDDIIRDGLHELETRLGDDVYMWCSRPVSTHEALGMIIEYTKWESKHMYRSNIEIDKAVNSLFGVKLSVPNQNLSRRRILRILEKKVLFETVACAFRYVMPGEYYVDHGADPTKKVISQFVETEYSILDTSHLFLHTFQTNKFFFVTRSGFRKPRPNDIDTSTWENISKRFRFGQVSAGPARGKIEPV